MDERMRDYMRRERRRDRDMDGRNPYGSRGGYVTARRQRGRVRSQEDYGRNRDRESRGRRGDSMDYGRESRGYYDDYEQPIDVVGYYGRTPFSVRGRAGYDDHAYQSGETQNSDRVDEYWYPPYDYSGEYLDENEMYEWQKRLKHEIPEEDKELVAKERVIRRAKEMGMQFDKFTEEEFYTAFLMAYTDNCKTFGKNAIDTYIRLAKNFLCDEDAAVRYGEKLATYYDYIVK